MASDITERWKASALSTALTIYPCQIRVHQQNTVITRGIIAIARDNFATARLSCFTIVKCVNNDNDNDTCDQQQSNR